MLGSKAFPPRKFLIKLNFNSNEITEANTLYMHNVGCLQIAKPAMLKLVRILPL